LDVTEWFPEAFQDPAYFYRVLGIMLRRVGAHRILFGTHYPDRSKWMYEAWCDLWNSIEDRAKEHGLTISKEQADLMRFGNAARLLKLNL
jgi:predicted TIM-barrel fold metal-dependent hydrolase